MDRRNKPIHGMLGGVVQRAAASPLYEATPADSAMDALRRMGRPLFAGGGDEEKHFDQLPKEVVAELKKIDSLDDERIEELTTELRTLAKAEDTELAQVEQAVEAIKSLKAESEARATAAEEAETKRAALLAEIDDPEPEAEGEETATPGDGDTSDDEGSDDEGTDDEGTDENTETETKVETPGGTEVEEKATTAAGSRRSPARTNARGPGPGAMNKKKPAGSGPAKSAAQLSTRIEDDRGNTLVDFAAAAQRIIDKQRAMGRGSGDGDFVKVGRLTVDVPRDREITDLSAADANSAILASVSAPEAIVAAGGLCAPTTVDYELLNVSTADRPVRDSLPQVAAPRGGVRFAPPVNFTAMAGAVDIWTLTDDADAVDDENVRKPCIRVECEDFQEVFVRAIPWCLTFGNIGARAYPEQVADALKSVLAMHARVAEAELLFDIAAESTNVTVPQNVSATRDILDALDRAVARYRYFYRTADNFPMRAIMPNWLRSLIRSDLARELPGSTDERLAVADATINQFFAIRSINVTWRKDEERGTTADDTFYGDQGAGALLAYPDSVQVNLFHEGAFGFLSMPDIDFGVVRDSTLNARNDYQLMAETFEGVVHRGHKAFNVNIDLCPSGSTSGAIEFDCPAPSGGS